MEYFKLEECCEILDSKRIPITEKDRVPGNIPYYGANGIQDYVNDYIFDDELVLLAEDGGNFGSKTRPIAYRVSGKCWVNNHAHVLKPKSIVDVDFLCYSLMFYNVDSIINGATRKKLTQSAMREMKIPKLILNKQLGIVKRLKTIEKIIDHRKKQLEQLDLLIKSRFVEMFGDPFCNNKQYKVVNLCDIASYYNGLTYRPENVNINGTIVLRSSNIQNFKLDFKDLVRVNCPIKDKQYVQKNDILMCSRNGSSKLVGKVALIQNIDEPMSFGAFMMIIRSPYFQYLMTYFQTDAFKRQISTGATTTINQITTNMLNRVKLPLPPIELQNKFARFVEQVEKSKTQVQKSLDEAQLLFNSLMQEYFG